MLTFYVLLVLGVIGFGLSFAVSVPAGAAAISDPREAFRLVADIFRQRAFADRWFELFNAALVITRYFDEVFGNNPQMLTDQAVAPLDDETVAANFELLGQTDENNVQHAISVPWELLIGVVLDRLRDYFARRRQAA